jgi:hypothetical protein
VWLQWFIDVGYSKHFRVFHGDMNLLGMSVAISTVLNRFGVLLNGGWQSLMARRLTLNCI